MKKILCVVFSAFALCAVANGQEFFNFKNNNEVTMSFGMSSVENNLFLSEMAPSKNDIGEFSLSASLYGFYLSASVSSTISTGASSSISVDREMPEGKCDVFHIGYKVPVTKHVSVYPLIGYVKESVGYCDGSDYYIDSDGDIHNRYEAVEKWHATDFGIGIDLKLLYGEMGGLLLSSKFTTYTIGISFGFVVNLNCLCCGY